MSEPEEDIGKVVAECGFAWPDDEAGQRQVLERLARMVCYWRNRMDECIRGVTKQRLYTHLSNRCWALSRRMHAIRKAAMEFRQGQKLDVAVHYRVTRAAEADAEKQKQRADAAEAEVRRLQGLLAEATPPLFAP